MRVRFAAIAVAAVLLLLVAPTLAQFDGERYNKSLPVVVKQGDPFEMPTSTNTSTPSATSTPTPSATPTSSPSPTATQVPVTLLPNGDFEQGPVVWLPQDVANTVIIQNPPAPVVPRSGSWVAETITFSSGAMPFDSPSVVVPVDKPYLSYWVWIRSTEPMCGRDIGGASIHPQMGAPAPIDDFALCAATQTDGWVQRTVDLSEYAGQTVMFEFLAGSFVLGEEPNSTLYWDDIGFQAVP